MFSFATGIFYWFVELIEKTSLAVDPSGFESIGRDDETLSVLKVRVFNVNFWLVMDVAR